MNILHATSADEIEIIRELFAEYVASLGIDLGYQGFAAELKGLPGAYAAPRGRLFLAMFEGSPVGCAALRPRDSRSCEMKRLYIRPTRQGLGLGRLLAERVIAEARTIGYETMLLDTLPTMLGAQRLYERMGFVRREPYFQSPIPGNVFMELRLGGR